MTSFTFDNMGSNGGSGSNHWNYSRPTNESGQPNDNYTLQLTGDIVEMKQVQRIQYETNDPLFWSKSGKQVTEDTGQPVIDFCIIVATPTMGEVSWIFSPKTKKTKQNPNGLTNATAAIQQAMVQANMDANVLDKLGGMNVTVWTQEPPQGVSGYGQNCPRPFGMKVNGKGTTPFRGCFALGESYEEPKMSVASAPSYLQTQMQRAMQATRQANFNQPMPQQQQPVQQQPMQQQGYAPQAGPGEYPPDNVYGDEIPF